MRPDPPDLPVRLEPVQTLPSDGLYEAVLSRAVFSGLQASGLTIDEGIRGATNLRGISMSWNDVLANAGVFAAACGVRVIDV